jgi:hypothetical protein
MAGILFVATAVADRRDQRCSGPKVFGKESGVIGLVWSDFGLTASYADDSE